LGLVQIDGALRGAGYETKLIDFNLDSDPPDKWISDFSPDAIGISLRNIDDALIQRRETFFTGLRSLCRELKRLTPAPLILGGSGFSIFPAELMRLCGADYGIRGEGEEVLLQLLDRIRQGGKGKEIPGVIRWQKGELVMEEGKQPMASDRIGIPGYEAALASFYLARSSMLNIQTQRGCGLRCCYCTYPLLEGRQYRRRPAGRVVDEMEQAVEAGSRYLFVVDSVFNTSRMHVESICAELIRRKLGVEWCCFLRPKGLTRELMGLMAMAGLKHVEFGSDSFCDSVLDSYGKQLRFEDILQSSALAAGAGIDFAHFLICGGPGETPETLETSLTNSRRLPPAPIMARVGMRIYPGTPLFERIVAEQGPFQDLLTPRYYVTPAYPEAAIFERLRAAGREFPNWIFEDPPPSYYQMAERLRARGVVGPLWSYFAVLQRIGAGGTQASEKTQG
jgi:radical SAM superfamily enzyme YgiQ (UPF0313 family)